MTDERGGRRSTDRLRRGFLAAALMLCGAVLLADLSQPAGPSISIPAPVAAEAASIDSGPIEAFPGAIPTHGLELIAHVGGAARAVAWADDGLLLVGQGPRIVAWDVSNPTTPRLAGESGVLPGLVLGLAVAEGRAWVTLSSGGVAVLTVETAPDEGASDPAQRTARLPGLAFLRLVGEARAVALAADGSHAYVARGARGLSALRLAEDGRLRIVGGPPRSDGIIAASDVDLSAETLLLSGSGGTFVLPLGAPADLGDSVARRIAPGAQSAALWGDRLITGDVTGFGFRLWNIGQGSIEPPAGLGLSPILLASGMRGTPQIFDIDVDSDKERAIAASGLYGAYVLDLRDPTRPDVLARLEVPGPIPGDARDTALRGDLAAVAGERTGALLYDLSQLVEPTPGPDPGPGPTPPSVPAPGVAGPPPFAMAYRAPGIARQIGVQEGGRRVAVVNGHGLDLVEVESDGDIGFLGRVDSPDEMNYVAWVEDQIYGMTRIDGAGPLSNHSPGLIRIDASDPTSAQIAAYTPHVGQPFHLELAGDTLLLALGPAGVHAVPLADYPPEDPNATPLIPGMFTRVVREGDRLFLVRGGGASDGIEIWQRPKGGRPERLFAGPGIDRFTLPGASGDRLWLPGTSGLWLFDVRDPRAPVMLDLLDMPAPPVSVHIEGNVTFLAAGLSGLRLINADESGNLDETAFAGVPGIAAQARRIGELAILAGTEAGLYVFRLPPDAIPTPAPATPTSEVEPTPTAPSGGEPTRTPAAVDEPTDQPLWLPHLSRHDSESPAH